MMVSITIMKIDYGPMATHERNAANGDIFTVQAPVSSTDAVKGKGKVLDLVLPIASLIVCCVIGMIYSGGFFEGESFVNAFANSDASVGLVLGSFVAMAITIVGYILRGVLKFKECMDCLTEGFKAMVPAIMILIFAWSLNSMTSYLGADEFVAGIIDNSAKGLQMFLPCVIFLIGVFLSFATGTSWGTFGILIPIVLKAFPWSAGNPISIVCVAACMAGAVCGDHCSPISDTTIMSSAGAQCEHVNHVSTQLPYAMTAAAVSAVGYLLAGIFAVNGLPALAALPVSIVLMVIVVFVLGKKD
jgi:Na+/H+ antiporter NhaC